MSASFAGSRSLDERRRRRLASEADEPTPAVRGRSETAGRRRRVKEATEWRGTRFPLKKIISSHRWKIWAFGMLLLLPVAGLIAAAVRLQNVERAAGPAVAELLDPEINRLGRAWGSFLLLVCAELSVLIWWVRSRSPADFGGRFGVWLWSAGSCFLFSACVATDAHLYFAETILYFRLVHFPQLGPENTKLLCWLAPAILFGAGLVRSLYLDMRRSWSSVFTLWLAVSGWLGSAFLLSESEHALQVPNRQLSALGAVLSGHVFLVLSFLLHARFVLYECSAPPEDVRRTGRLSLAGLLAAFRRTSSEAASAEPEPAEETAAPRKARSSAKKSGRSAKKTAPRRPSKASASVSEEIEEEPSEEDVSDESLETDSSDEFETSQPSRSGPVSTPKPAPSPQAAPRASERSSGNSQTADSRHQPAKATQAVQPQFSSNDADDGDSDDESDLRLDGPDPEMLKGLSKRERRRLQKQWRDQQRG